MRWPFVVEYTTNKVAMFSFAFILRGDVVVDGTIPWPQLGHFKILLNRKGSWDWTLLERPTLSTGLYNIPKLVGCIGFMFPINYNRVCIFTTPSPFIPVLHCNHRIFPLKTGLSNIVIILLIENWLYDIPMFFATCTLVNLLFKLL